MTATLASWGLVRCEAVLHCYEANPIEGGRMVPTCDSVHSGRLYSAASMKHHVLALWPAIPLSHSILTLSEPALALS